MIKWIGQHIVDLIARFRSDVYLEDIETGTIASGANLGLDSNNKIVKNTVGGGGTTDLTSDVTGILPVANGGTGQNSLGSVNISDLNNDSGFTSNTGDITSIKLSSSVGSHTESSGAAEFLLAGSNGLTFTNVNETFTVTASNASLTGKGVVELATTAETTTGTDDTRAVTPDGLKDGYQGSTNVTTLGSITTGIWRGDVIDQAYLGGVSGTNTGDEPDATTSTKGIVELATTAEANAGTDTARAVTPAGLKSHVDDRSVYQYISFVGNITANTSGNGYWEYPSPNGISNHTWTQIVQTKVDGTDNRDTTTVGDEVGIDRLNQGSSGIRIPYAGTIVGFTGSGRNASGDRTYYGGLFVGTPDWGTTNKIDAELVAVAQADNTPGGTYTSRASKVEDLSRSYSISAGDVIYPAIKGSGTNADIIQVSFTIVIKTPIV